MTAQQNQNLRDELFPDGLPEPEEFIRTIASYIQKNHPDIVNSNVPNEPEVN